MGLTYRDKDQLIAVAAMLLPYITKGADALINADKDKQDRQLALEKFQIEKDILGLKKEELLREKTTEKTPVEAWNKWIGRDVSGFADPATVPAQNTRGGTIGPNLPGMTPMIDTKLAKGLYDTSTLEGYRKATLGQKVEAATTSQEWENYQEAQKRADAARNIVANPNSAMAVGMSKTVLADIANSLPELNKAADKAKAEWERVKSKGTKKAPDNPDEVIAPLAPSEVSYFAAKVARNKMLTPENVKIAISRLAEASRSPKGQWGAPTLSGLYQDLQTDLGITPIELQKLYQYYDKIGAFKK